MTPLSPEAVPGTDDLEPRLYEVSARKPRAEDVVLLLHLEFGISLQESKMRLCAMNFESVEL